MLLTIWIIFVSFFSVFFVGIPAACFLNNYNKDHEILILAPFLGIAIIILFLQNLIYLSFPIGTTFYWLYFIALISWIYLISKKKLYQLKQPFFLKLLLIVLLVYFVNAAGLIIRGANAYVGHGWFDFMNYVYMSEYLIHFKFSVAPFAAVNHIPYALKAITLLGDRIGVSILQGFISASAFTNAKSASGPTVLLSCVLVTLALYRTAREFKLTRNLSLIAGMGAALPAAAYIHLDCFFSQALVVPFLLIWPYILYRFSVNYHWKNFLVAALILAAAATIYTEFYPLFIIIAIVCIIAESIQKRPCFLKPIIYGFGIFIMSNILNIGFIGFMYNILQRVNTITTLGGLFPWADSIEGWNKLWLGDWASSISSQLSWSIGIISLLLLIMAYSGIIYTAVKRKNVLACGILVLSILPLPLLIDIETYKYQFYKILISISPMFFIGICLWIGNFSTKIRRPFKKFLMVTLTGIVVLSTTSTFTLSARAGYDKTINVAFTTPWLTSPLEITLGERLLTIKNKNIVIIGDDFFYAVWLSYFARFNHVWIVDTPYDTAFTSLFYYYPKDIPKNFYLLIPMAYMLVNKQLNKNVIWHSGEFVLIDIHKPTIIIKPYDFNIKGLINYKFYSTANGVAQLHLDINATVNAPIPLQINIDGYKKTIIAARRKQFSITLPIKQGEHNVHITPIVQRDMSTIL